MLYEFYYFLTRRLRQNTYLDHAGTLQVEEYGTQLQIQVERWRQRLSVTTISCCSIWARLSISIVTDQ